MPYNPQLHSHQHLHHHHHNSHQSLPRGNNINSGGGGNFLRDSSPAGTNSSSNTTTSSSVTYQPLPPPQQQMQPQSKFPGYPQYNTQQRLPTVSSAVYEKRPPLGPSAAAARGAAYSGHPGSRPSYTTLGPARSGSAMAGSSSQSHQGAKQFDSYYYHPATLRPNHQNSNATSQYRGGGGGNGLCVDYADLSIQQQQQQQQQQQNSEQLPHLAGRGNTDYAVLQFNKNSDVGKEIDV